MREWAVVTGAGSGIGRAVAVELAAQGFQVAGVGRRADALAATEAMLDGEGHASVSADLTVVDDVERGAGEIADLADAGVAALVHCAGGLAPGDGSGLTGLRDSLRASIDANLTSTVLLTEALRDQLTDHRARVIATSSIAAVRGGGPTYGPAKAALHAWAFAMAGELGPRGITVNVIAPGYVSDTEFFGDAMTSERHDRLVAQTMIGRSGRPDDIAWLVGALVSPRAGYLTGQVINANGGAAVR